MTERLALLPLTGAGETHCQQCNLRTYWPDVDTGETSACPLDGSDREWGDERLPECIQAERDAARLRVVDKAAVRAVELLQETRFMAMGGGPIAEWAKTPEGKNHALVWKALQALRAALKEE